MKSSDVDLYLLRDGTYADPKDCGKGDDGVLRHKNGVAVALQGTGEPETLRQQAVLNGNLAGSQADESQEEPKAS